MNFHFKTLGCKVNQYETQAMKEAVLLLGHTSIISKEADAVIINSCTVTAESDRKTGQMLRQIRNKNKNAVIVLTGCMVQAFPEKAKALEADIIIGNKDISEVINAINKYKGDRFFEVKEHNSGDMYKCLPISDFSERTRAFMKIEDGCNRYCSYCIIPKARGFVRSRPIDDIKNEAIRLSKSGYKEIVLVGINLSAYGLGTNLNICDAVETVSAVEGICRVRLGSIEPDYITDDMLHRLKSCEKFCPQFHLSLQSGCDETLVRMNRHYDTAFYYDLLCRIRKIFKNTSITTDIMVGFAGESDEEFNKSVRFVKKAGFSRSHIFSYSRRPGTAAERLPGQIPNSVKQERAKIMAGIAAESEKLFLKSQINSVSSVLFEMKKDGANEGYTPNYTKVIVIDGNDLRGQIKDVRITKAFDNYCLGELV